jgi:hypothetical protein
MIVPNKSIQIKKNQKDPRKRIAEGPIADVCQCDPSEVCKTEKFCMIEG